MAAILVGQSDIAQMVYNNARFFDSDSAGVQYAITNSQNGATPGFYKSIDNGDTWTKITMPTLNGTNHMMSMVVSNDDKVYIVSTSGSLLKWIVYDCKAETFGVWAAVGPTTGTVRTPSLCVSPNGNIQLVYAYTTSSNYYIGYSFYNGTAWSANANIYSSGTNSSPTITSASDNSLHVAWTLTSSSLVAYARKLLGGSWSVSFPNDTGGASQHPTLTVDNNDIVHLAYTALDAANTSYQVRYKQRAAAATTTWASVPSIIVSRTANYYQYNPSIAADAAGEIHLVWHNEAYVSGAIMPVAKYTKRSASGWIDAEDMESLTDASYYPTLAPKSTVTGKMMAGYTLSKTIPYKLYIDQKDVSVEKTPGYQLFSFTERIQAPESRTLSMKESIIAPTVSSFTLKENVLQGGVKDLPLPERIIVQGAQSLSMQDKAIEASFTTLSIKSRAVNAVTSPLTIQETIRNEDDPVSVPGLSPLDIAVDTNDNVYILAYDESGTKLYKTNNWGKTYENMNLPISVGMVAKIVVNNQGLSILYIQNSVNYPRCIKYSFETASWGTSQIIGGAHYDYSLLAISGAYTLDGNLHVVYAEKDAANPNYAQVKYSMYNGSVWSAWVNIAAISTREQRNPVIAVLGGNNLHVAFEEEDNRSTVTYKMRYATKPAGGAWTTSTIESLPEAGGASLLVIGSVPHLVYQYRSDSNVRLRYATLSGTSWSTEDVLATEMTRNSISPNLIAFEKEVHLLFLGNTGDTNYNVRMAHRGTVWIDDGILYDADVSTGALVVASHLNTESRLPVAWSDNSAMISLKMQKYGSMIEFPKLSIRERVQTFILNQLPLNELISGPYAAVPVKETVIEGKTGAESLSMTSNVWTYEGDLSIREDVKFKYGEFGMGTAQMPLKENTLVVPSAVLPIKISPVNRPAPTIVKNVNITAIQQETNTWDYPAAPANYIAYSNGALPKEVWSEPNFAAETSAGVSRVSAIKFNVPAYTATNRLSVLIKKSDVFKASYNLVTYSSPGWPTEYLTIGKKLGLQDAYPVVLKDNKGNTYTSWGLCNLNGFENYYEFDFTGASVSSFELRLKDEALTTITEIRFLEIYEFNKKLPISENVFAYTADLPTDITVKSNEVVDQVNWGMVEAPVTLPAAQNTFVYMNTFLDIVLYKKNAGTCLAFKLGSGSLSSWKSIYLCYGDEVTSVVSMIAPERPFYLYKAEDGTNYALISYAYLYSKAPNRSFNIVRVDTYPGSSSSITDILEINFKNRNEMRMDIQENIFVPSETFPMMTNVFSYEQATTGKVTKRMRESIYNLSDLKPEMRMLGIREYLADVPGARTFPIKDTVGIPNNTVISSVRPVKYEVYHPSSQNFLYYNQGNVNEFYAEGVYGFEGDSFRKTRYGQSFDHISFALPIDWNFTEVAYKGHLSNLYWPDFWRLHIDFYIVSDNTPIVVNDGIRPLTYRDPELLMSSPMSRYVTMDGDINVNLAPNIKAFFARKQIPMQNTYVRNIVLLVRDYTYSDSGRPTTGYYFSEQTRMHIDNHALVFNNTNFRTARLRETIQQDNLLYEGSYIGLLDWGKVDKQDLDPITTGTEIRHNLPVVVDKDFNPNDSIPLYELRTARYYFDETYQFVSEARFRTTEVIKGISFINGSAVTTMLATDANWALQVSIETQQELVGGVLRDVYTYTVKAPISTVNGVRILFKTDYTTGSPLRGGKVFVGECQLSFSKKRALKLFPMADAAWDTIWTERMSIQETVSPYMGASSGTKMRIQVAREPQNLFWSTQIRERIITPEMKLGEASLMLKETISPVRVGKSLALRDIIRSKENEDFLAIKEDLNLHGNKEMSLKTTVGQKNASEQKVLWEIVK